MFRSQTKEELGAEFRSRAQKFVAVSDHDGLLKMFSEYMEEVLAEVFRRPLDDTRHDWFDHIK